MAHRDLAGVQVRGRVLMVVGFGPRRCLQGGCASVERGAQLAP